MTVRLADAEPTYEPFTALALTPYVAGVVPAGIFSVNVEEPVSPGFRVNTLEEKALGQPEGWFEPKVKALAVHPLALLFVTEIA